MIDLSNKNKIDHSEMFAGLKFRVYAEKKDSENIFLIIALPFGFLKEVTIPKSFIKENLNCLINWLE